MKIREWFMRVAGFVNEVGLELKKSAWPTRQELIESTFVVIVSVVLLGVFIGFSDVILLWGLKAILGR